MAKTVRVATATLDDALADYERWRSTDGGFSPRTWAGEKGAVLAFVDHVRHLGSRDVDEVGPDQAASWFAALKVAPSTKVTRLAQIRAFTRFCVMKGWISKDPTWMLRAEKPMPTLRDRLTAEELLNLVECTRFPSHRMVVALAVNLGLRSSEIRDLRIGDVNLPAQEIGVRIPKTKDAEHMPITAELDGELRAWLAHYDQVAPGALTPRSYLVPSQFRQNGVVYLRPGTAMGKAYPAEVIHWALDDLGWPDTTGEGVHTVRRSLARVFFDDAEQQDGFDSALLATMSLLNHSRPETTLRYIGRDRAKLARDRILQGQPFLTRIAGPKAATLKVVK